MKCLNPLNKFFTVWPKGKGGWVVGGVKMCTWTKVAGNLMKCLNPLKKFLSLFGQWARCQNVHLNQSLRKFDEIPKSTKTSFSLFGQWDRGFGWWGCQNVHLNQSCNKFDEMPKSTKKIFFTVWPIVEGGWVVEGVKMCTRTKVAGNLMKCLNPLNKIFFIFWPMEVTRSKCAPEPKLQEIWWNA